MNFVNPFHFEMLLNPWMLLLLLGVLALAIAEITAKSPAIMVFSAGDPLASIRGVRSAWMRHIPAILRAVGLALLILAIARPVRGMTPVKSSAEVIDIMLVVDLSVSMLARDFYEDGELRDRLYVTKAAVTDFVNERRSQSTTGMGKDRLGLVYFGAFAWTQCPLTLDYDVLLREVDRVSIDPQDKSKQATAIGSAVALGVSRLRKSEAKSKVVVLLTDGSNNAGEIAPETAAELAKEYGIRVYTIGAGSDDEALMPTESILGRRLQRVKMPMDEGTLIRIAEITGAKFFRASNFESLKEAYAEINKLETTKIETDEFYDFDEAFAPFAIAGGLLLVASVFSRRMWFEPIP